MTVDEARARVQALVRPPSETVTLKAIDSIALSVLLAAFDAREEDSKRLDWLDENMPEVFSPNAREAIDAALSGTEPTKL